MKRLIQICLILIVLMYTVSCAPSGAVVSGGVGVGVGAYPAPVYVRPYYGYRPFIYARPAYRYYYHPGYRYNYHYRRY